MSRKLITSVVHKGKVYPAGTYESDIDNASKIGADVWDGQASPAEEPSGYDAQTVEQLKDEIRKRNEGRDDDAKLPLTGTKAELVAALSADDA